MLTGRQRIAGPVALVDGTVRTFDDQDRVVSAIGIVDGRIAVVGTSDAVLRAMPSGARVIDLAGRAVLPGLIDAHAHVELSTMAERLWIPVHSLDVAGTIDRITRAVRLAQPGDWVIAQGTFGQALPSRAELDRAAPTTPVIVRESMHLLVANSPALAAAGIRRDSLPPHNSRVLRDHTGTPTGLVQEGFDLFPIPFPPVEWLTTALREETLNLFVRHGVTTIHELPATTNGVQAWQAIAASGTLPCRITLNPILAPGHQPLIHSLDEFLRLGLTTGFGNDWLRLGALKIFVDGGDFDSGFYRDALQAAPAKWGLLNFHPNELAQILARCRQGRLQVWMHTIGDAAQDIALTAVEQVNSAMPGIDHRTRIEHLGNHTVTPALIDRIRAAGVIPVPNAVFIYQEADALESRLPPDTSSYPYQSLISAGLITPGNSDCAGTQPFAANPWFAITSMINRQNRNGILISPDQAVDIHTAITTYTRHSAYAAYDEHTKGSLEPGKLGDLAIYPTDPLTLTTTNLTTNQPDLTIIGGHPGGRTTNLD